MSKPPFSEPDKGIQALRFLKIHATAFAFRVLFKGSICDFETLSDLPTWLVYFWLFHFKPPKLGPMWSHLAAQRRDAARGMNQMALRPAQEEVCGAWPAAHMGVGPN